MEENNTIKTLLDEMVYFTPYSVDIFQYNRPEELKQYMDKFGLTTDKIKGLLFDSSTAEFIQDKLVPSFNLNIGQGKEITRIIRDTLLADVFMGDMAREIQKRLQVDQNKASQIGQMILSELFAPAMEEIKTIHRQKFGERQATERPRIFSNPAVNLDINKNNILDLRNRQQ